MDRSDQPCRCLWRGFAEQMTKFLPLRRTILQLSQMRLTLDRTFMAMSSPGRPLWLPEGCGGIEHVMDTMDRPRGDVSSRTIINST